MAKRRRARNCSQSSARSRKPEGDTPRAPRGYELVEPDARFRNQEDARAAHHRWHADATATSLLIQSLMKKEGLSLRKLHARVGFRLPMASVLSGRHRPRRATLRLLADALRVDPRILLKACGYE